METIETHLMHLDQLLASLAPERLGEIDFDRLRETLAAHRQTMAGHAALAAAMNALHDDHATLRQDYIGRIAGMAKAIAVATHRHDAGSRTGSLKEALAYVESLESKTAAELIEQYRLTSARFREAFPTSFLHLRPRSGPEGIS